MSVVINLDLLANNEKAERGLVKYIASAVGMYDQIPAHRFVIKAEVSNVAFAADTISNLWFYGYRAFHNNASQIDFNKFFYGDCTLFLNAINAGPYSVDVDMYIPSDIVGGLSTVRVFHADNIVNPMGAGQAYRIDLPMSVLYVTNVRMTTGVAGSASIQAGVFYNGLAFSK